MVWQTYRSDADDELKAAVLMMATFLVSPQSFNYDLIPAAAAALILWRRDGSSFGRGLALAVWALPLVMIALQAVHIVVAPVILLGATWKLYALRRPSRIARASTGAQAASNT